MADDVTLLPCPFCGGTPYVNDNDIWTYMECECGAQGPQADTKAEAREVWNSRVSDPRIAALEAQLAEARDWSSTLADAADDLRAELREAQQILAAMQAGTCVTCKHCEQWTTSDGEPRAACTRLSDDHKVIEFVMAERDFCSRWREKGDT